MKITKIVPGILLGVLILLASCEGKKNIEPNGSEKSLLTFSDLKLGWGKGRASHPGYLAVNNGVVETFMTPSVSDRVTQEKIDLVFPGDWGSSGGALTIASPSSSGAGGAAYEYCKDWLVRKSTQIVHMPASFDARDFEAMTTVRELVALESERRGSYSDWLSLADARPGRAFIFKTEEGHIGIGLIQAVNGTYGGSSTNLVLSIKLIPQ